MNEINSNNIDNSNNILDMDNLETPSNSSVPELQTLQAQNPYYYDYYGEKTLENHQTIIQNQEKILETSYTISFFIAIALVLSMFRNMWRR